MGTLPHYPPDHLASADDVTPCPRCGVPLAWLGEDETVRGQGGDRMHSRCWDGERR